LPKVRTSTYEYILLYVYRGIWQYMAVHCITCKRLSLYMAVHDGALQYKQKFYHCIWQYIAVHCSTCQFSSLYMTVPDGTLQCKAATSITVYGSTWQYTAVLSFWICASDVGAQSARLKALHWGTAHKCMHTQIYSASGTLVPEPPLTPFCSACLAAPAA
jgi:hypothetical protein